MWDLVATGSQHISLYAYDMWPATDKGLINDDTTRQYYGDIVSEMKSLEPILVLPTKTYSWEGYRDDSYVSITPNSEKNNIWPDCGWCLKTGARRFTYLLKQPDSTHSYLIVVNKDISPSGTVEINVPGIPLTATVKTLGKLGTGSGAPGRQLTATNGKFIDFFDGYAVHIYQICAVGDPCTVPADTCTPIWQCETPLNGYEFDGCGSRRLNSMCNTQSANSLTLKPGWNQISSPVAAGIDLATIESSCTILPYKNQKLWAWNAQTQAWINPTKVEPFKGYWIYAAYQCTVPLSGTAATFTSLPLTAGWNKISAQGTFLAIQGTCAGHITGNWVWNWDKATERWVHPTTMQLDKGYWIKVDQNCVLGG